MLVRALLLALTLGLGGVATLAEALAEGSQEQARAAFSARQYGLAEQLWSAAAERGDPEGLFGLALLRDGGYGRPRDPAGAYDLYLRAAESGLAQAQFNVAVMSDAGIGTPRDARAAMTWYTRAALRGNGRAQYNLGLMIEAGAGSTPDPERAAIWFRQAANLLPAAAERMRDLDRSGDPDTSGAGPDLLFAERDAGSVELAWAPDGSGAAPFDVEMAEVPPQDGSYRRAAAMFETRETGLLIDDPAPGAALAIRVIRRDAGLRDYRSSGWMADSGPVGRVIVDSRGPDGAQRRFVDALATDLRGAGIWVTTDAPSAGVSAGSDTWQPRTEVVFGWRPDGALAASVASLLPDASKDAVRFDPASDLAPGEVRLRLASGG